MNIMNFPMPSRVNYGLKSRSEIAQKTATCISDNAKKIVNSIKKKRYAWFVY